MKAAKHPYQNDDRDRNTEEPYNSPRPMTSSCFTSFRSAEITKSVRIGSAPPRLDSVAAPQRMTRRVVTRNPAAILPFRFSMLVSKPEGWPSGLRRTLGKRVYGKPYRGFESHSLRHPSPLRGFGWQATNVEGAKGVSRSSAGAQGDFHRLRYVYFLELRNSEVYVGSTDNLRCGFASHQNGKVLSTRGARSRIPSLQSALIGSRTISIGFERAQFSIEARSIVCRER